LRDAGAVLLGTLNMHEFAWGATSINAHFGTPRNPWDTERIPGGSSGGSGVATRADLAMATMGSDTGGSVRWRGMPPPHTPGLSPAGATPAGSPPGAARAPGSGPAWLPHAHIARGLQTVSRMPMLWQATWYAASLSRRRIALCLNAF